MGRKILGYLGCALTALTICLGIGSFAKAGAETVLSPQSVYVDGTKTAFEVYNIDGSNYFKLRDIAKALSATKSSFAVGWDGASSVVSVTTGGKYVSDGSEMDLSGGDKSATAVKSSQTVTIDGRTERGFSVYNIGGNNFFKLRDLGATLGFTVNFDAAKNSVVILSGPLSEHSVAGSLRVSYIDVGQGDSIFIELPNGQTMLIDAGEPEYGDEVAAYIKDLGYATVDYVVASHPHSDHIGGLPEVFSELAVRFAYAPDKTATSNVYKNFVSAVANEGLTLTKAAAGEKIVDYANLDVTVLSPKAGATFSDINDYSAEILVTYGSEDFLFTGDASANVTLGAGVGDIDVLKVAHHGSRTGTTAALISALKPEYAVISCGAGNRYGHPHSETLAYLAGVQLYRTDLCGTVVAATDGLSLNFKTEKNAA